MTALRLYLFAAWAALAAYSAYVFSSIDIFATLTGFFAEIGRGSWTGLVNLDLTSFVITAALWIAWRNSWRPLGWLFAYGVFSLGGAFLWGYLLVLLHRERGDLGRVLLGEHQGPGPNRRWTD